MFLYQKTTGPFSVQNLLIAFERMYPKAYFTGTWVGFPFSRYQELNPASRALQLQLFKYPQGLNFANKLHCFYFKPSWHGSSSFQTAKIHWRCLAQHCQMYFAFCRWEWKHGELSWLPKRAMRLMHLKANFLTSEIHLKSFLPPL
jgi:hypothetical protein